MSAETPEVIEALAALERCTAALTSGESRPGQREMAGAAAQAIADGSHLVVEAGTGTGKSLAYLVPILTSDKKAVVATATKALQDQLADRDLPFLTEHLGHDFSWAVLKGRSNYVCRQRLDEYEKSDTDQLALDGIRDSASDELAAIAEWAESTTSGDRAELTVEPSDAAWGALSVSSRECPGAAKCPAGDGCFAELARSRASAADIVVVNTYLYGIDLAAEGMILPEHDVVVIDEAHQLGDIISETSGAELGAGRLRALGRFTGAILVAPDLVEDLNALGDRLDGVLEPHRGRRVRPVNDMMLVDTLGLVRAKVVEVLTALKQIDDLESPDLAGRKARCAQASMSLVADLDIALALSDDQVAWVDSGSQQPRLEVAPIDVAPVLSGTLWEKPTVVLTSATLSPDIATELGADASRTTHLDVGSPFDYEQQALLYCPAHLPDPRDDSYAEEMLRELERLIVAAGGRTLALFTSHRAMNNAADTLEPRLPWKTFVQGELPKGALLKAFADDETSCLFATASFWQGVDVPGPSLSLVTIDRIPFPRPDDPLLQARRELARADAFRVVDLRRARTMLAQGAGRLIRSANDAGVVAVLDPRLAKSKSYRWELVRALPPMRRTKEHDEAVATLTAIRDRAAEASDMGDDEDDA